MYSFTNRKYNFQMDKCICLLTQVIRTITSSKRPYRPSWIFFYPSYLALHFWFLLTPSTITSVQGNVTIFTYQTYLTKPTAKIIKENITHRTKQYNKPIFTFLYINGFKCYKILKLVGKLCH